MLGKSSVGVLLLGLYMAIVCPLAGAVEASESKGEAGSRSAPVTFVDQQPLEVSVSDLAKKGEKGLAVTLHNELESEQILHLQIFGQGKKGKAKLEEVFSSLETSSGKEPVEGNGFAELTLPLADEAAEVSEGPVKAVLIASGDSPGIERRPITIKLEEKQPRDLSAADKGNVLRPASTPDLTLVAVNLLPSPLSSTGWLFLLGALALVVVIVLVRWGRGEEIKSESFVVFCALCGVAAIVGWGLIFQDNFWDQAIEPQIQPRSVGVSSEVSPGNVGVVASGKGAIAQLVVDKDESAASKRKLVPAGLDGAGAYSGTYDLDPGKEGEGKATINVRDFWPYALLMIALGLYIAYLLHRYYEKTRPAVGVQIVREEIEGEYKRQKRVYEQGSTDFAPPSLDGRFKRLRATQEEKLDEGDAKAAQAENDTMRKHLVSYGRLLTALASGRTTLVEFQKLHGEEDLEIGLGRVKAHRNVLDLLQESKDWGDVDDLDGKLKEVMAAEKFLRGVTRLYGSIMSQLIVVRDLLKGDGKKKEALEGHESELEDLGTSALLLEKEEGLAELEEKEGKVLEAVRKIKKEIGGQKKIVLGKSRAFLYRARGADPSGGLELLRDSEDEEDAGPEQRLLVEVAWRRTPAGEFGQAKVYREDHVEFRVTVRGSEPPGFDTLKLDFGDGASTLLTLNSAPEQTLSAFHLYEKGGKKWKVKVLKPDETPLASAQVEVDYETKPEKDRKERAAWDRAAAAGAFALAVASGMALYFNDPAWGESQDYLAALVWGGIAGEGVKFAAGIAKRVLSSG